jgi:hypothetical protein
VMACQLYASFMPALCQIVLDCLLSSLLHVNQWHVKLLCLDSCRVKDLPGTKLRSLNLSHWKSLEDTMSGEGIVGSKAGWVGKAGPESGLKLKRQRISQCTPHR